MSDGKIFVKKSYNEVNEKVTVEDIIEVIENMPVVFCKQKRE